MVGHKGSQPRLVAKSMLSADKLAGGVVEVEVVVTTVEQLGALVVEEEMLEQTIVVDRVQELSKRALTTLLTEYAQCTTNMAKLHGTA